MPAPVIPAAVAGSGILSWLWAVVAGIFVWVVDHLSRRYALAALYVAAAVAAAVAMKASIDGLVGVLVTPSLPAVVITGMSLIPGNTSACLGAVVGANAAALIYRINLRALRYKSRLS